MKKIFTFMLVFINLNVFSSSWGDWIELYKDNYTKVEIQFKIRQNSCKGNRENKYRYKITGDSNPNKQKFIWILKFRDCNNNLISNKLEITIGGSGFVDGMIQDQDYTFMGTLETDFSRIKIEPIIYEINDAIKNNRYDKAQQAIEKLKKETDCKEIVDKVINHYEIEVDGFFKNKLSYIKTSNEDINIAIDICKNALHVLYSIKLKSYYSNQLIYFQNELKDINEKQIIADINDAVLNQNYDLAITIYNNNRYEYTLDTEKKMITNALSRSAENNFKNKNYYKAKRDYSKLYELTLIEKYRNKYRKIDKIIIEIENKKIMDNYKKLYANAKISNNIYSWEKVYYFNFDNKDILNNVNNGTEYLYELWNNRIKENYKKAKKLRRKKDLLNSQEYLNKSVSLINDYYRKDYSKFKKLKHEREIMNSSKKVNKKINKFGTRKVINKRDNYVQRKQVRKTLRLGVSYNIASFSSNYIANNGFDSIISSSKPFLDYINQTDLSYFNFNAFYGRFGIYISDIKNVSKAIQFNSGIYIKMYKSIYFKMGYLYTQNEKKDFYVSTIENYKYPYLYNKGTPLYIGLSIISALEFEIGYNLYTNTMNLGIGFSLWKKHKKIEDSW